MIDENIAPSGQVEQVDQPSIELTSSPALPRESALRRLVDVLGIDGVAAMFFWVLILGLVVAVGGQLRFNLPVMWEPLLGALLGMVVCFLCRRPFWQGLAEWGPFVALIALYVQVEPYTRLLHGRAVDAELAAIDTFLFGGVPSEMLAPYRHPFLTELMALGYSCYLILMFTVAPAYIPTMKDPDGTPRMRYRQAFRATQLALVLELGLGFFLYILVPARGPRYFFPDSAPLYGAFGYYDWAISGWNAMQVVTDDAFPSLHTATGVISIVFSFRLRRLFRPLPYLAVVPATVLILSTVYLRMHYVVDVVAGVANGLFAAWAGSYLVKKFHGEDPNWVES
ncbi:MAG: phosphatase PAP2 family protein [Myxococcales bacterium]|nr:phosphatase PAP2 family protein [Myxococcales bacterium]